MYKMKRAFLEQVVLFVSIIKWSVLSTLVGVIVGSATSIFLKALDLSIKFGQSFQYYWLFLPATFFFSSLLIKLFAPDAEGHGTEKVIEAVHKNWGKVKFAVVPIKTIATIITLAGGGSAGKEGPSAQIGAGLASKMADIIKLNKEDRKKLVICGISAGFSTVFGTPVAGALFAVEVLVLGKILHSVLFPSLVAAIISFQISKLFGIVHFHQIIHLPEYFSKTFFIEVFVSGIFFGFVSFILIETLKLMEKISEHLKMWKPFKGLIGGSLLIILLLISSPKYLGLGIDTMESLFKGSTIPHLAFLWKILFTSITLSTGGSGGIITPIFYIGATSGSTFAHLLRLNPAIFAAIGMVAVLSGTANTPIAASVMAIELFGSHISPYASIACVVSFIVAGHRSVYPSQILGTTKSSSISIPLMTDLSNIDINKIEFKQKPHKVITIFSNFYSSFKGKLSYSKTKETYKAS